MKEYVITKTKNENDLNSFFNKYPNAEETMKILADDFKGYKIIKNKTIQQILGCSEEKVSLFVDYFIEHEWIENLDAENYFVLKSNADGLWILLRAMAKVNEVLNR